MSSSPQFTLCQAQPANIPQLAAISARAFARDANTQMKAQGQKPGAFEEGMAAGLRMWIDLPPSRCVVLKAVERGAGRIVGWVCWGVRGLELTLPASDDDEEVSPGGPDQDGQAAEQKQYEEQEQLDEEASARIKRFEAMTSEHLAAFQKKIMPEGTRCMYIISVAVDPAAQGRGVGARLVRWGTEQADGNGVFCWVQASEAGWRVFAGKGFVEVERLTVDLDEWAVGTERGWGEYTFRYMVRRAGGRGG